MSVAFCGAQWQETLFANSALRISWSSPRRFRQGHKASTDAGLGPFLRSASTCPEKKSFPRLLAVAQHGVGPIYCLIASSSHTPRLEHLTSPSCTVRHRPRSRRSPSRRPPRPADPHPSPLIIMAMQATPGDGFSSSWGTTRTTKDILRGMHRLPRRRDVKAPPRGARQAEADDEQGRRDQRKGDRRRRSATSARLPCKQATDAST